MPHLSGPTPTRHRLRMLRRHLLLRRRLLVAVLAGVGVVAALRVLSPPPPPTVAVSVAARDLPAGAVLGSDDVVTRRFPEDVAPTGLAEEAVGRVLAGAVSSGEPLTDVRLVGPALARAQTGEQAVPVRLPDSGMAALLRPGDEVDLVATDPADGDSRVVAAGVRVLTVPAAPAVAAGGSDASSGTLVVFALSPDRVRTVTGAALAEYLTIAF